MIPVCVLLFGAPLILSLTSIVQELRNLYTILDVQVDVLVLSSLYSIQLKTVAHQTQFGATTTSYLQYRFSTKENKMFCIFFCQILTHSAQHIMAVA